MTSACLSVRSRAAINQAERRFNAFSWASQMHSGRDFRYEPLSGGHDRQISRPFRANGESLRLDGASRHKKN
jgi:hypothetical protein